MHLHLYEAAIGVAAALAVPAAIIGISGEPRVGDLQGSAETVEIAQTVIDYPLPGEFLAEGRPSAAPIVKKTAPAFRIMKHQVSLSDYNRCAAESACDPADATPTAADVPVTGVSFLDAEAYARWYSKAMGETWRLPTALEAAAAGGERFGGESFSAAADDAANPAVRWLRRYREEAAAKRPADPEPKPRGHYGPNSRGIEDFGGNVWEWTSTCHARVTLNPADGAVETVTENCGVHILEGRHRATMSNFVRDGKSGGCAVGTPPENLGFRLVRDQDSILAGTRSWIGSAFQSAVSDPA
ncbi:SUMF1/EgtB/PvdO family nonheme iron enzyme [Mesorhizobium sp. KR9-304]|uniref:SUMF1/EgtB/PvdO family nonheme iron enzyme n=1 Tax=Mesorhizobium sp. KR9-304 TaxID=3156614 RepID=UPI0032B317C0